MKQWQELLLGIEWEDVEDEYGPNTHAVVSAFEVFAQMKLFRRVGKSLPKNSSVFAVHSWEEAIAPLIAEDREIYGPNGHLSKPSQICIEVIESERYHDWWQRAAGDAFDYYNIMGFIPKTLEPFQQDFVYEYVYEFVSFLLAEIVGAEVVDTTYFREMLSWFHTGRFPCGWVGEWPDGHMRVY